MGTVGHVAYDRFRIRDSFDERNYMLQCPFFLDIQPGAGATIDHPQGNHYRHACVFTHFGSFNTMGVQQIIKMVLGIKPYSFHAPSCDTLFKILLPTTIYRINYGERDKGIAVTSFGLACIPQLLVSALCVLVKHTIEVTDYTDIGTEFTHSTQQSVRMVVFKTSKRP